MKLPCDDVTILAKVSNLRKRNFLEMIHIFEYEDTMNSKIDIGNKWIPHFKTPCE